VSARWTWRDELERAQDCAISLPGPSTVRECSYLPQHVLLIRQKHERDWRRQFDDSNRRNRSAEDRPCHLPLNKQKGRVNRILLT